MNRTHPPARYYFYVMGTVNLVMGLVIALASLAFSDGVNVVSITILLLIVNIAAAGSVRQNA